MSQVASKLPLSCHLVGHVAAKLLQDAVLEAYLAHFGLNLALPRPHLKAKIDKNLWVFVSFRYFSFFRLPMPKIRSNNAQERSKRAPERPKMAQEGPKMAPRRPQDGPKTPQDGPKKAPRRPQDGSKTHLKSKLS